MEVRNTKLQEVSRTLHVHQSIILLTFVVYFDLIASFCTRRRHKLCLHRKTKKGKQKESPLFIKLHRSVTFLEQ
jgi:hypothetical protein